MCEMCRLLEMHVSIVGTNPESSPEDWKDSVIRYGCEYFVEENKTLPPLLHMLFKMEGEYLWAVLDLDSAPKEMWQTFGSVIATKMGALATVFVVETWQAMREHEEDMAEMPMPSECSNRTENVIFVFEQKDEMAKLTNFEIIREEDGGVALERRKELEEAVVSGRMVGFMTPPDLPLPVEIRSTEIYEDEEPGLPTPTVPFSSTVH